MRGSQGTAWTSLSHTADKLANLGWAAPNWFRNSIKGFAIQTTFWYKVRFSMSEIPQILNWDIRRKFEPFEAVHHCVSLLLRPTYQQQRHFYVSARLPDCLGVIRLGTLEVRRQYANKCIHAARVTVAQMQAVLHWVCTGLAFEFITFTILRYIQYLGCYSKTWIYSFLAPHFAIYF